MVEPIPVCVFCGAGSEQAPLLPFMFHSQDYWICAQHLPVLIHEPAKLAGKLPGAEMLKSDSH